MILSNVFSSNWLYEHEKILTENENGMKTTHCDKYSFLKQKKVINIFSD